MIMLRESRTARSKTSHFIWIMGLGTLLFGLLVSVVTSAAAASAYEVGSEQDLPAPALQGTATPTATLQSTVAPTATLQSTVPSTASLMGLTPTFSFSLADLGYEEKTLKSPYGQAQYSFGLPENWTVEADGALDLDLSYVYYQTSLAEYPALFGDLKITLDNETLEILPIDEAQLDHYLLRVPLPSSVLNNPDRALHNIAVILDAGFLCKVPHRAKLVIHPTSSISLTYDQRPLVLDLSRYPRPFYQRAFEPDSVRFVLPSQPAASELSGALAVAAKLGDLTSRREVISATTDLELTDLLSTTTTPFDEHLIVFGQPQDNQLLPLLNDVVDLPVSLHRQQLGLIVQGPAAIAPDDAFTYAFTITNTMDRDLSLSLISSVSPGAELMDCTPDCTEDGESNSIIWADKLLAPAETVSLAIVLKGTNQVTGTVFENTVTLVEAELGPVNADTLTSVLVADSTGGDTQVSAAEEGDYFFVYDGKAVAKGDGIVEEIVSPWSEKRAILIVTGLSDEAVRKASLAMSSETRFPGMSGPVALVQDAPPPSAINSTALASVEMTFADLGYSDQLVQGGYSAQQIDYYFEVPYGWQLAQDAHIDLYFSHSQLIDYANSGLTVLLNGQPAASTALGEETASGGHLRVGLADANVWGGRNRLTLEMDISMPGVCIDQRQAWLLVKSNSKIYLEHFGDTDLSFDLNLFPYPFHLNPALTDVLFALPNVPSVSEWEAALRLAASLGDSAAGDSVAPTGVLGDGRLQDGANYHIIAVGRPSRNALIQQVNPQLPQPFLPGSDEIEQGLDGVVFRLPAGLDLGYLQLIPSPWNEKRALLVVTGTTDEGMKWATDTLTDRYWLVEGNLVLVKGEELTAIDTRELTRPGLAVVVATAVPEMASVPTTTTTMSLATPTAATLSPSPATNVSVSERATAGAELPAWLIPLVVATGLVVIAIFAAALWRSRRRGTPR
jgi:hypothetical protein